jgi:predicted unusual protein kinase regulating ubiquinone biosynthesis (AarF/ABC1/UbiB family)
VRLQSYLTNDEDEIRKSKKRAKLDELHEKHAPDILQVMLDLKGLYIKLGQGEF